MDRWLRGTALAVAGGLLLSACDGTPMDVEGQAEVMLAVQEAVLDQWHHLPSEEEVEEDARAMVPRGGESGVMADLTWSAVLHFEGVHGRAGGNARAEFVAEGRSLLAQAAVQLLGEVYAQTMVSGVQQALASVEAAASGGRITSEHARGLAEARAALHSAAGLRGSNPAGALDAALQASGHLRGLAPEKAAQAAIQWAADWLVRARAAAAGSAELEAKVGEAESALARARASFDAGDWRDAVHHARLSASISRRIVAATSGDGPGPSSASAAERAISMATDLLVRAEAAVGSDGTDAQLAALAEARTLLAQAEARFEAGEYPAAIRLAVKSGAISRRLIHHTPPTPPLSAMADRAIHAALAGYAKAEVAVARNPTEAGAAALAEARALIGDAQGEAAAGNFQAAMRLALEAIAICRRIVLLGR